MIRSTQNVLPQYNASFMDASVIGRHGIDQSVFATTLPQLDIVRLHFVATQKDMPIFALLDEERYLRASEQLANVCKKRFSAMLIIGIGGSDLGTKAVYQALGHSTKGMRLFFAGAHTDPEALSTLLAQIDFSQTCVNVISKSGETVEPMATFFVVREKLIRTVGQAKHAEHVVVTTGEHGVLRTIAQKEGYAVLDIPKDIGGRFSVGTSVGIFPFACAGISFRDFLDGARTMRDNFLSTSGNENTVLRFVGHHFLAEKIHGQRLTVLMPYATALEGVGQWWRQLWAESLGKKCDRQGNTVHRGLTPVVALGPTDQHSQIQLYNEGPFDKVVTFLRVQQFREQVKIPDAYPEISLSKMLTGHDMGDLMRLEQEATARGMVAHGRPNGCLEISSIDERTLGGLLYFFMVSTLVLAELWNIDPYDQPGVEQGKRELSRLLE